MFGHGAEVAFGEAFSGDGESAVKTGAGVFPGNDGGEFDELGFGEVMAKGGIELVFHGGRGAGHGDGQAEYGFFLVIVLRAGFKVREIVQLVFGDAGFSAHGRVDVNSKRTAYYQRYFELCKFLQMHRDNTFRNAIEIHAERVVEVFRDKSANPRSERNVAEPALCKPENQTCH